MSKPLFSVRRAASQDLGRMFECYRHTMRQHVNVAWGWDDAFQREGFERAVALATSDVLEVQGQFGGFIWLQATSPGMMLRLICIEPAYQGMGIGTHLIKAAAARHPGLRLKVFKSNRAIELYRRLGFREIESDEHMWEMEHGSVKVVA